MNSTNLQQIDGGTVIKQSDTSSVFAYRLLDENNVDIDLNGKQAKIQLFYGEDIYYETSSKVSGSIVKFTIDKVLGARTYGVEIECDNYIFPSNNAPTITVIKNVEDYVDERLILNDIDATEIGQRLNTLEESTIDNSELNRRFETIENQVSKVDSFRHHPIFFPSQDGNPYYDTVRNRINFQAYTDKPYILVDNTSIQLEFGSFIDMSKWTTTSFVLGFNIKTKEVRAFNAYNSTINEDFVIIGKGRKKKNGNITFDSRPFFQLGSPESITLETGTTGGSVSVSHRGYNRTMPEQSADAYMMAASYGMTAWEGDVFFTADGIPVMHHDTTINRIARNKDGSTIANTINIESQTLAQLNEYDWGISKHEYFSGTKILTFENWVKLAKSYGVEMLYIELKSAETNAHLQKMIEILKSWDMYDKSYWLAFDWTNFNRLATLTEDRPFIFLLSNATTLIGKIADMNVFRNGKRELWASPSVTACTPEQVRQFRDAGFKVYLWTATTRAHITKFNDVFVDAFGQNGNVVISRIQKEEIAKVSM